MADRVGTSINREKSASYREDGKEVAAKYRKQRFHRLFVTGYRNDS